MLRPFDIMFEAVCNLAAEPGQSLERQRSAALTRDVLAVVGKAMDSGRGDQVTNAFAAMAAMEFVIGLYLAPLAPDQRARMIDSFKAAAMKKADTLAQALGIRVTEPAHTPANDRLHVGFGPATLGQELPDVLAEFDDTSAWHKEGEG